MSLGETTYNSSKKNFYSTRHTIFKAKRRRRKLYRRKVKKAHFKRQIVQVSNDRRILYLIIEESIDVTPKPLYDAYYSSVNEKTFTALPFSRVCVLGKIRSDRPSKLERPSTNSGTFTMSRSTSQSFKTSNLTDSKMAMHEGSFALDLLSRFSMSGLSYESEEVLLEDKPPSLFLLRQDPPPRKPVIPTHFTVSLTETETFYLLETDTTAERQDSEASQIILKRNSLYESNINKNKSISQTATQTGSMANVRKKRFSLISRNKRQNAASFAAAWDIYDTYKQLEATGSDPAVNEETRIDQLTTVRDDKDDQYFSRISFMGVHLGKSFFDSLLVIERLIMSYNYKEKQLLFQGLFQQDPLSLDLEYRYSLRLLWTFKQHYTENKVVTTMSLSPTNDNIIAVGYGKFKYTDNKNGLICCWNTKNPATPERLYKFEEPVTSISFSKQHPNILAVSFYSGLLILLDVTKVLERVMASNNIYPLYYPVRRVCWFKNEDEYGEEFPVTCGKDGRIFKYRKTEFFTSKQILSVTRIDGKVQGTDQPRKCYPTKVLVSRHPSAECMVPHPIDPVLYYIGTSEGCVYKCSVNYCHHHLEVFVAHKGPVYAIEFHPHCPKIFLTCGGDWCINVWAEGVFEPLISLISGMQAVECAIWHPLNSTIIVSITGKRIEMWDIRRKTIHPKSTTLSPSNSFNTALTFTRNGHNLCVGDDNGNVHVLALAEMPFSPMFQEAVLVQAIKNALISKQDLLKKVNKLGPPFKQAYEQSKLYRNLQKIYKFI